MVHEYQCTSLGEVANLFGVVQQQGEGSRNMD